MNQDRNERPLNDLPRMLHEMRQAVREALRRHKLLGDPVAVWEDGRVKWIEAKDIPEDLTRPLPDFDETH